MQHIQSAGGVVINQNGEVVVVSQGGKTWSLPKGHMDAGEDALAAARREIYEETGIRELEFVKKLGSYDRHSTLPNFFGAHEFKTITLFLFRTSETLLAPVDPLHPEARWVPKNEVAELLTHPKDKAFFRSVTSSIF